MDIMIDIETLGCSTNAVILQIAACRFDPLWAIIDTKSTFCCSLQITQQVSDHKRVVDASTVAWWLDRPNFSTVAGAHGDRLSLREALCALTEFFKKEPAAGVWANSPTFDLAILSHAYRSCELPIPWNYKQERDVRTLKHLPVSKDALSQGEVAHHALEDTLQQAQLVCRVFVQIQQANKSQEGADKLVRKLSLHSYKIGDIVLAQGKSIEHVLVEQTDTGWKTCPLGSISEYFFQEYEITHDRNIVVGSKVRHESSNGLDKERDGWSFEVSEISDGRVVATKDTEGEFVSKKGSLHIFSSAWVNNVVKIASWPSVPA